MNFNFALGNNAKIIRDSTQRFFTAKIAYLADFTAMPLDIGAGAHEIRRRYIGCELIGANQ